MSNSTFNQIERIIKTRRTTKAHAMNGRVISDTHIQKLLELADYAPNHGQTEPWRFLVFSDEALHQFGQMHADLYWAYTDESKRRKSKYNKYINYAESASHIIAVTMRAGTNPKIPEKEERSAVSAAIQNILLGATALGIASFWSTSGMAYHPEFKMRLGLDKNTEVIGVLYLGYADNLREEKRRRIPLEEKVTWAKNEAYNPVL